MRTNFILILIIGTLLFIACPNPGSFAEPFVIEDFNSMTNNEAPSGDWLVYTHSNASNQQTIKGVIINNNQTDEALYLSGESLGGTFGQSILGYSFAQIAFDAPAPGKVFFDFIHTGWNSSSQVAPNFKIEFWIDADAGSQNTNYEFMDPNYADPPFGAADWIHQDDSQPLYQTCEYNIPTAGTYRLTWRVVKDNMFGTTEEDVVYIDNIKYEPK